MRRHSPRLALQSCVTVLWCAISVANAASPEDSSPPAAAAVASAPAPAVAPTPATAPTPARLEFATGPLAGQPSVALEPGRGFIVSWQEASGAEATLHYATLDFSGRETARGVIARGRDWFVNWADVPGLVVLDNGDWVAFWLQRTAVDAPEAYDIRLVRSRDRGRSWSVPLSPHRDGTATQHGFVSLLPEGGDRVRIAWLDGRLAATPATGTGTAAGGAQAGGHDAHGSHDEESAPMTLRTAVLDRRGALSDETLLDARTCSCCQTDAARTSAGTTIVYRDRSDDEIRDIGFTTRGRDGRWSTPAPVHVDGWRIEGCPVNGPALAANGARLLVVWPTLVGQGFELRYALGEPAGNFATAVLSTSAPVSGRVDAAAWGEGFLASWVSRARDSPAFEYTSIDAAGRASAPQTLAQPTAKGRAAGFPRLASSGEVALFAWTESVGEGSTSIALALLRR